uniref:NADH dehydrogenase [ubiquinone] 1 alpha subcomplex subunit 12 n=1 Tax=Sus scrofa TaxID=9823 RepID=A0A4X1SI28_PIG
MELVQVLRRGLQQVSGHGGLRGYLRVLFRANDVRVGTLVGEDKYGNKYYEDNKQFFGRHRWVIYTTEMNGRDTFWDVDGSMVPPEWVSAASSGRPKAGCWNHRVGPCLSRSLMDFKLELHEPEQPEQTETPASASSI